MAAIFLALNVLIIKWLDIAFKINMYVSYISSIHNGGSGAPSDQAMEAPSRCSHNCPISST